MGIDKDDGDNIRNDKRTAGGCGLTMRRAFLRLLDHRSVVPKDSLVPLVIADPDDANLGAQGRAACDGVQGSPTLRQLEAEEVW